MPHEKQNGHLISASMIYSYLGLTETQLIRAAGFIQHLQVYSNKAYLTFWERLDYEYDAFSRFLDNGQLKKLLQRQRKKKKDHENTLIEDDCSEIVLKNIERSIKEIEYLESIFLPAIKKTGLILPSFRHKYANKIDFIKSQYKTFLKQDYLQIISNHFRESRHFQPNKLRSELLKHKTRALYPTFSAFRANMDELAKSATSLVSGHLKLLSKQKDKMQPILNELHTFRSNTWKDYDAFIKNSGIPAFNITVQDQRTEEVREQDFWFSLLLIDDECYGYADV